MRGDRHAQDLEALGELLVVEWVVAGLVAGLFQIGFAEFGFIHDADAAVLQVADVGLERGRVHRHQSADLVTRGIHRLGRKVDLKTRHARDRALGRADFGRIVGEGGDVVAEDGAGVGQLRAGQLHAVAGVAGEADDGGGDFNRGGAGVIKGHEDETKRVRIKGTAVCGTGGLF